MKPKYDIVYGQKFTTNGEEKTRWTKHGVVLIGPGKDGKGRMTIKLDSTPTNFDGYLSVFPIDKPTVTPAATTPVPTDLTSDTTPLDLDSIPF